MRFVLILLLCAMVPATLRAQEGDRPILRMELETESAIPGQPIGLRITVLTPTWFPQPPVFPSFEVPNAIVRLPPRGSGPTSERIGRETWSGVTRNYRIYPMVPGRFRIPPRPVTVTYADADTRQPVAIDMSTEAVDFRGLLPEGAEGLDPFIAARELALEQTIEGSPESLEPGDAVVRVITARITGTSPMFLPPLTTALEADGLSAYPDEPLVTETDERGVLSGERTERVTYVAETGGRFAVPPIRLQWFDLETGTIETAELDGFEILSRGPVREASPSLDLRAAALAVVAGAIALLLLAVIVRWLRPRIAARAEHRRAVHRASEAFAFRLAIRALKSRHLGDAIGAVDFWSSRLPAASEKDRARLADGLAQLGASFYGRDAAPAIERPWSDCIAALRSARRERLAAQRRPRGHLAAAQPPGRAAAVDMIQIRLRLPATCSPAGYDTPGPTDVRSRPRHRVCALAPGLNP